MLKLKGALKKLRAATTDDLNIDAAAKPQYTMGKIHATLQVIINISWSAKIYAR
jgi:hypothetical protein